MSRHYSNPKRESDPHALPDVEVFYMDADIPEHGGDARNYDFDAEGNATPTKPGWYWWLCFPGCLPDSDAIGPFDTEAEALADAQANADDNDDNDGTEGETVRACDWCAKWIPADRGDSNYCSPQCAIDAEKDHDR